MAAVLQPWQIFLPALAGWISREQDAVIEYLREENRVLKQQLGRGRLRLTDDQRRRLAVRGKAISQRALVEIASLVTPGTILRWHRQRSGLRESGFLESRVGWQYGPERGHILGESGVSGSPAVHHFAHGYEIGRAWLAGRSSSHNSDADGIA